MSVNHGANIDELYDEWCQRAFGDVDALAVAASIRDLGQGERGEPVVTFLADFEQDGIARVKDKTVEFGVAPENELADFELRQLSFKTPRGHRYRAVFTILDDEVLVLRIRGPGQPALRKDEIPLG